MGEGVNEPKVNEFSHIWIKVDCLSIYPLWETCREAVDLNPYVLFILAQQSRAGRAVRMDM